MRNYDNVPSFSFNTQNNKLLKEEELYVKKWLMKDYGENDDLDFRKIECII